MPDEPFPIPDGMTKEMVMDKWNKYQQALQHPDFNPAEAGERFPLFKTFNDIQGMNADVVFSTDVETPDDNSGLSLGLRIIGMTGQGLGTLAGPPGAGAGFVFNTLANAAANSVDASSGRSTEAVPFSSMFGDPITTGNPVADAAAESTIDGLLGLGVLSKAKVGIGRIFGKDALTDYVSKRIDPKFIDDMKQLGQYGLDVPLTMKSHGIGGAAGKAMSNIVSTGKQDEELSRTIARGLEDTWRNAFKLDIDNPAVTDEVMAGFNNGLELGRKVGMEGLGAAERQAVVSMSRFNRNRERLLRMRNGHFINFKNSAPSVTITPNTLRTLSSAKKSLEAINITGDSKLNGLINSITNLRDKLVKRTKTRVTDSGVDVSTMEPTKEVGFKFELEQLLEDPSKNKHAPRTVLELIDGIDRVMANAPSVPQTRQSDMLVQLKRVRDSLEGDVVGSLTPQQVKLYDKFRTASAQINSTPNQIVDNISAGEITGFMESMIKDPNISRKFMQQGVVTQDEARSMLGDYLLGKGRSTTKDGKEVMDYVAIKNFVDDPKNRAGITEIMGSDNLGIFRQFANVAANTAVTGSGQGVSRNLLSTFAGAVPGFVIMDPGFAATGMGIALTTNQFLKSILFNPKIGRQAIEALKMPANDKNARKIFSLMMSALNGHEAAAIFMNPQGEQVGEEQIVIRNREGGQPRYAPLVQ